MYSIKAIFDKQPTEIATAVRTILFVMVLAGVVGFGEQLLAGIALALELVLALFVIRSTTSKSDPTLKSGTTVKVQGSSDTVVIQPTPPGPVGFEGGPDPDER